MTLIEYLDSCLLSKNLLSPGRRLFSDEEFSWELAEKLEIICEIIHRGGFKLLHSEIANQLSSGNQDVLINLLLLMDSIEFVDEVAGKNLIGLCIFSQAFCGNIFSCSSYIDKILKLEAYRQAGEVQQLDWLAYMALATFVSPKFNFIPDASYLLYNQDLINKKCLPHVT